MSRPHDDLNYEELDPNIREVVRLLRGYGFNTTDSGDGSKADMGCGEPIANVYAKVGVTVLQSRAQQLHRIIEQHVGPPKVTDDGPSWTVQGLYLPAEGVAIIELHGVTDDMLSM